MSAPPVPVSCWRCGVTVWRWTLELPSSPVLCSDCGPKPCAACGGTGQGLPVRMHFCLGSTRTAVEFEACRACQGSGRVG